MVNTIKVNLMNQDNSFYGIEYLTFPDTVVKTEMWEQWYDHLLHTWLYQDLALGTAHRLCSMDIWDIDNEVATSSDVWNQRKHSSFDSFEQALEYYCTENWV